MDEHAGKARSTKYTDELLVNPDTASLVSEQYRRRATQGNTGASGGGGGASVCQRKLPMSVMRVSRNVIGRTTGLRGVELAAFSIL